jgi:hypothetical protein
MEYLKRIPSILEDVICNSHPKENVILLEIERKTKYTKIDFYTARDIGIPIVCITELSKGKPFLYEIKVLKFL